MRCGPLESAVLILLPPPEAEAGPSVRTREAVDIMDCLLLAIFEEACDPDGNSLLTDISVPMSDDDNDVTLRKSSTEIFLLFEPSIARVAEHKLDASEAPICDSLIAVDF